LTEESVFAELLSLEQTGPEVFRSPRYTGGEIRRLFGGHLLAQALWAAGRALDPVGRVASLRGLFLRPSDPRHRLTYRASVVKAGRSLSHRRVVAEQGQRAVFVLEATFDLGDSGPGPVHSGSAADPAPEGACLDPAFAGSPLAGFSYTDCFDLRFVHPPSSGDRPQPFHPFWVRGLRLGESLLGDPLAHACALAFVSDMGSLSAAVPRTETLDPFGGASVEHVMWFGPPTDLRGWHRIELSPALREGRRGLAHGAIRDEAGRQVAVVSQLGYF
jgi:acyl-CoA thioesterase-2